MVIGYRFGGSCNGGSVGAGRPIPFTMAVYVTSHWADFPWSISPQLE